MYQKKILFLYHLCRPIIIFSVICFFLTDCSSPTGELVVCGDDKILIIDEQASNGADVRIVWSWKVADAATQLPEAYQEYLRGVDDCKAVDGGKNILATAGRGVVLIERATKKCLFYAYTPNAHSAEVLPGGRIAVALSTHAEGGNSIEIYNRDRPEQVLFKDSLYSGHGVVWNAKRQRLYALGYDELREYSLVNWDTSSPALQLEKKWKIPGISGHDLSPVSDDELLISEHEGVHSFDITSETFTPFEPLKNIKDVKSVNYIRQSRKLVYTKGEESWWTFNIYIRNPDKTINIPDVRMYKVRLSY